MVGLPNWGQRMPPLSSKIHSSSDTPDPGDSKREVNTVHDLTFGEYIRLLSSDPNWAKLGVALDRSAFVEQLETIRDIRNEIMHFSLDPLDDESIKLLHDTARFLAELVA